jgi:hypothetical protein
MGDQWNEKLRCLKCLNAGSVSLSQFKGDYIPTVDRMPNGFRVAQSEYGIIFECSVCNVSVDD